MTRKMKDSGISWIRNIPETWKVKPVKRLFINSKEIVGEREGEFQRLSLTLNGVIKRSKVDDKGLQPQRFQTYQIINKDELIFKLIDLENVRTSRVGYSNYTGLVSPVYIRLINPKETKFGYYFFTNMWHQEIFNFMGSGVRSNLTARELLNVPYLSIPEYEKQRIIIKLDYTIEIIQTLIDKSSESISELKEYKQSIITEAVTKGLNPDAEMKESKIKWLSQIPAHWEINKAKYLFHKMDREIIIDETVTAFRDGQVIQRKKRRTQGFTNSIKEIGYQGVAKGDLVIHSMDAFAGAIGISEDNGKCSPVCIVVNNKVPLHKAYFSYLLRSYAILGYIESMATGIRVRSSDFRYSAFASTPLIVPPLEEQLEILNFIKDKSFIINKVIRDKTKLIEELENYKKSVIYEYVTGKKEA